MSDDKILKKPLPNNPHQAPLYLIVYDISDNKERNKVDDVLHNFGFRVQKSVYECRLTRAGKKQLFGQLEKLQIQTGHIRCYSVMSEKVTKIGDVPTDIDGEYIYFVD